MSQLSGSIITFSTSVSLQRSRLKSAYKCRRSHLAFPANRCEVEATPSERKLPQLLGACYNVGRPRRSDGGSVGALFAPFCYPHSSWQAECIPSLRGRTAVKCVEATLYKRQNFLWAAAELEEFTQEELKGIELELNRWKHNHEFCARTGVSPSLCRSSLSVSASLPVGFQPS